MEQKPPTMQQVAKAAGVSVATVSRVVNGLTPEHSPTARRVRQAIVQLGFRPSRLGRNLKTATTATLGLVVPSLDNPVFAASTEGVRARAKTLGYSLLLTATSYDRGGEEQAVETLLSHHVDGIILTVGDPDEAPVLRTLDALGLPYVLLYNQPTRSDRPAVTVDNVAAARALVERLTAAGHRRIGMVAGHFSASDRQRLRWIGFEDAIARAGLLPGPVIEVDFDATSLTDRLADVLAGPEAPTALFCSTDILALAVFGAAVQLGLAVPRDLSLVGFDGIALSGLLRPALTTVIQPSRDMGRVAVDRLAGEIAGEHGGGTELLPYEIRDGETIGPAKGAARRRTASLSSPSLPKRRVAS